MPAITQELAIGIGFNKQPGTGMPNTSKAQLQTPLAAASLWALNLNSFNPPFPQLNAEDDGPFFGKGDEYPRALFPTSIDANWEWPFHLTSQNWTQAIVFAVHNATKTPAGTGFKYVCTPPDRALQGVNLPATTVVTKIRDMLHLSLVGMVCTGFTLRIQRGPGLANTSMTSRWLGCGQYEKNPAGLPVPELHVEQRLGSGSLTSLILGDVDYFANARIVDVEYTWDNGVNGDSGYFPGSGQLHEYDLRGRMRYGRRTQSLVWSGEWENDSTELTQLEDGIEGSCSLKIDGPELAPGIHHSAEIALPRTRVKTLSMTDADGFVTARVETTILKDPTQPWVTLTGVTDQDGIGEDS